MIALIEKFICKCRNTDPAKLHERDAKGNFPRNGKYVLIKQLVIYYAIQNGYTEKEAGAFYGQDHSTAHHAKRKIDNLRNIYRDFRFDMNEFDNKLKDIAKLNYKEIVDRLLYDSKEKIELIKTVLPELETKSKDIERQLKSINLIIFDLQKETIRTDIPLKFE